MRIPESLLAAASLLGVIVGAGIFGLPYIFSKSGILISFFYFLAIFFLVLLLHLFLGETVLRTKEKHRLVGYAEKYLGKKAKIIASFSILFGVTGSLVAYIILAGHFLSIIFPAFSGFHFSVISWAIFSVIVFLGIRSIASMEFFFNIGLLLVFAAIAFFSARFFDFSKIVLTDTNYFFLPFGVFLFSMVGWNAVPEIEGLLKKKKNLKKVIFWSLLGAALFYFVFGAFFSGVSGQGTTKEVFQGLIPLVGKEIMVLGSIFGFFTVATSFLVLASYLKNTFFLDFRLPHFTSFLIACFLPIFLFLAGIREFLVVVAFVGSFIGLIDGAIIVLIWRKAKKYGNRIPEYSLKIPLVITYGAIFILVFGALSQLILYFK